MVATLGGRCIRYCAAEVQIASLKGRLLNFCSTVILAGIGQKRLLCSTVRLRDAFVTRDFHSEESKNIRGRRLKRFEPTFVQVPISGATRAN